MRVARRSSIDTATRNQRGRRLGDTRRLPWPAIVLAGGVLLSLERHGGRSPAGLWARIVQRLLALNATIWFNWLIGAPVKRSLIAYDH